MVEVRGVSTNAFGLETLIFLRKINVSRTTHFLEIYEMILYISENAHGPKTLIVLRKINVSRTTHALDIYKLKKY